MFIYPRMVFESDYSVGLFVELQTVIIVVLPKAVAMELEAQLDSA